MIRALGYSCNDFDSTSPGRLCRGRERWIEPYPHDIEDATMQRTVVTGAIFTDDSAADALRGIPHSGVDLANIIAAMFPRKPLIAFMEDGHPADIPEDALGVELYTGHRAGGRSEALMVRWFKQVSGVREIRSVLGKDMNDLRALGFALLDPGIELDEELFQRFFRLVGMSNLDSPPARFQPAALPEVLEVAKAVIMLHRDKHGPAVGVYSRDPIGMEARLQTLCDKQKSLLVRFAIPPMLARWDRAIAELRAEWVATREEEFPVPPAPEPSNWEPRRRDRRRRRNRDDIAREAVEVAEAAAKPAESSENLLDDAELAAFLESASTDDDATKAAEE